MKIDYDTLFYHVDNFCMAFEPWYQTQLLSLRPVKRKRQLRLSLSEIMTILIAYHQSGFVCFKHFYQPLEEILTSEDIIELNSSASGKVVVELPGQGRIHRDYPVLDRGYWVRLCTVLANLKRINFDSIQNPIFSTQRLRESSACPSGLSASRD